MTPAPDSPELVLACFKCIFGNASPDFYSYANRLAIQKISYFLKAAGLAFNERHFGWYIKGPYSASVASLAYHCMEKPDLNPAELTDGQIKRLDALRELVTQDGKASVDLIELYGSLEFMLVEERVSKEEAVERFLGRKPWFGQAQVEKALHDLLALRQTA